MSISRKNSGSFPYPKLSEVKFTNSDAVYSAPASRKSNFSTISNDTNQSNPNDEDSIKVVIRVRPFNTLESQRNDEQSIFVMEDAQTIQIQTQIDSLKQVGPMTFHKSFNEGASQDFMFEECGVKKLIEKAIEGFNATVFAYGQTGSGKTFTITGPDDVEFKGDHNMKWGVVPRSLRYIFDLTSQLQEKSEIQITIRACYLEIYNEQVQDLLNPTKTSLPIRYTNEKGFYVENLFVVECEVLDDCLAVLEEGLRNRKTASHRLNEHSSRSHGMMTIFIETETVDPDDHRVVKKMGKICFVDLAGSEKVKESKAQGETLTETLNINKSLLTLGNCISALSEMKKKKNAGNLVHVPYRDSKLTKLLSDTLGGNGIALMIACVSPSSYNINETMNTLRYASRAKRIQNKPVVQMDPREAFILGLKQELKSSKQENEALRLIIQELSLGKGIHSEVIKNLLQTVKIDLKSPKLLSSHKESEQAKEALQQFMLENQELKDLNDALMQDKQILNRTNQELMQENEKLNEKIEKLSLMAETQKMKPEEQKKSRLGFLQNRSRNSSQSPKLDQRKSEPDSPAVVVKSSNTKESKNEKLKKELNNLDWEIQQLSKEK